MSRVQIYNDILSVFTSDDWTSSTSIKVTPENYSGDPGGTEFIRPNIIIGGAASSFGDVSYNGLIRFDIFVEAGPGPLRSAEVVDLLSAVFERKVLSSTVQTFVGNVTPRGTDQDEPQYYRVNYAIPFNYNN